jgi:hypothetical protein
MNIKNITTYLLCVFFVLPGCSNISRMTSTANTFDFKHTEVVGA